MWSDKKIGWTAAAVVLIVGIASAGEDPAPKETVETAATETEPKEQPSYKVTRKSEEPTIEMEVVQASSPQSCLEAIEHARTGFGHGADFADATSRMAQVAMEAVFEAAQTGDVSPALVDRMEAINADMEGASAGLEVVAPKFNAAAAACENE